MPRQLLCAPHVLFVCERKRDCFCVNLEKINWVARAKSERLRALRRHTPVLVPFRSKRNFEEKTAVRWCSPLERGLREKVHLDYFSFFFLPAVMLHLKRGQAS